MPESLYWNRPKSSFYTSGNRGTEKSEPEQGRAPSFSLLPPPFSSVTFGGCGRPCPALPAAIFPPALCGVRASQPLHGFLGASPTSSSLCLSVPRTEPESQSLSSVQLPRPAGTRSPLLTPAAVTPELRIPLPFLLTRNSLCPPSRWEHLKY